MNSRALLLQTIILLFILVSNTISAQPQKPLRIAVSANFAPVLTQLIKDFNQQTKIKTQLISASTGTLFQQISHGAPFDVFLAADKLRPKRLADKNLILSTSRKTYAYGRLALYSAVSPNITLAQLNDTKQRFAIANPNTAPYGLAAKQSLLALGLWTQLQNKLVTGININQTFQQIRSKAVSAGIVAYSQLILNNLAGQLLPSESYQAIEQQVVILKNSQQIERAKKFTLFLLSKSIQRKIKSFGYGISK